MSNKSKKAVAADQCQVTEDPSARIIYQVMPEDKILILGFKNILTAKELRVRFGEEIANIYLGYPGHMRKEFTNLGVERLTFFGADKRINVNDPLSIPVSLFPEVECITVGSVITKKHFNRIVVQARTAGKLMSEVFKCRSIGSVNSIKI